MQHEVPSKLLPLIRREWDVWVDIVQQVSQRRVIRLGVPHQDRGADHEHVGFRREGVDALRANDTLPELSHRKEDARELRIARVCETGVGARRGRPA